MSAAALGPYRLMPGILNPKPQSPNHLNPKPLSPKPKALNPKPETLNAETWHCTCSPEAELAAVLDEGSWLCGRARSCHSRNVGALIIRFWACL